MEIEQEEGLKAFVVGNASRPGSHQRWKRDLVKPCSKQGAWDFTGRGGRLAPARNTGFRLRWLLAIKALAADSED
jgi:hypothetical protein